MSLPKKEASNILLLGGGPTAFKLDDDDARQSPRRRVLKTGIVTFSGRNCSIECSVRDLSDTGARLRATGSANIPDTFELIIETDGFEADCQVVWRKDQDIGVVFLGVPKRTTPTRRQVIDPIDANKKKSLIRRKPIKA